MDIRPFITFASSILLALALSLIVLCLTGCAGSATDRDFRSKVKSVEITGSGGSNRDGTVTAGAGAKFEFRDPSK